MRRIRAYTYFPTALEEPQSDSSPHQWTSTAQAIEASFHHMRKLLCPLVISAQARPVAPRFLVCTSEPGTLASDLYTAGKIAGETTGRGPVLRVSASWKWFICNNCRIHVLNESLLLPTCLGCRRMAPADTARPLSAKWGSSGRRFKSCQADKGQRWFDCRQRQHFWSVQPDQPGHLPISSARNCAPG